MVMRCAVVTFLVCAASHAAEFPVTDISRLELGAVTAEKTTYKGKPALKLTNS